MPPDVPNGDRGRAVRQEPPAVVLVIEDDAEMRRLLARALSRKYRVVEAEDGRRGVEVVKLLRPAVVITDIVMPDKDGIETIREIQALVPGTKIVAISGGGLSGNRMLLDEARAFGVDAVLAKPFALEGLLATVEKLLRPTLH
jgi:DNA-binding response OmpR family regulator